MSSFSDFSLSEPILRAIKDLGFDQATPIQTETLPILLGEPTDFLGLAGTGTGKTAAFGLPMLERLDTATRAVQALILCPTRELALQVSGQITLLGKHKGIRAVTVYGGSSYADQIHGLKSGAQVVVGTPGRVVDHLDRGTLKLDQLKTLILDEADEMISMGFKEELEKILESVPREQSNTWLFSATMNSQVSRVADEYLRNPKQVRVNRTEMLSSNVEQIFYPVRESDKPEVLCKLIEAADDFYGVIFCQTKLLVADLTTYLIEKGYKADCLHGDKDQNARERTMQAFRDRRVRILICTDVASRGLDVKDITHVVNYSLPREMDNYVHRIGRTARSGKTGIAINLVTKAHRMLVTRIERFTKSRMVEGVIPGRREIAFKKVAAKLPSFTSEEFHSRALEVMGEEWTKALEGMTAQEVAARFLALSMPEVFSDRPASAHKAPERSASAAPARPQRSSPPPYQARREERSHASGDSRPQRPAHFYERRSQEAHPQQRREERDSRPQPRQGQFAPRPKYKSKPRKEFGSFKRNEQSGNGGGGDKPPRAHSTKLGKSYASTKRREYNRREDPNVRPRSAD